MSLSPKKVGITGASGFVGTHLRNYLNLFNERFEVLHFERHYFENNDLLDKFVIQCDVIVHLAALNRHFDEKDLYSININLVNKLIDSLVRTGSKPHVIISSSTQEVRDNYYGRSKCDGRKLLDSWAKTNDAKFTGLIIPNVFGPFGKPFYNSVIATFCHQLTHNQTPKIEIDGELKLIYVGDLVKEIVRFIELEISNSFMIIESEKSIKVSELLSRLNQFRDEYQQKGQIPMLSSVFDYHLFNTFRSFMDLEQNFPRKYIQHADHRGAFTELLRADIGGQFSFSTTLPGITRGNHFHTRKIERFSVIKGKAKIELRRVGTNEVISFLLHGEHSSYVDMPIWYTHNITNVGDDILYTCFWINEPFDPNDPDTYFQTV